MKCLFLYIIYLNNFNFYNILFLSFWCRFFFLCGAFAPFSCESLVFLLCNKGEDFCLLSRTGAVSFCLKLLFNSVICSPFPITVFYFAFALPATLIHLTNPITLNCCRKTVLNAFLFTPKNIWLFTSLQSGSFIPSNQSGSFASSFQYGSSIFRSSAKFDLVFIHSYQFPTFLALKLSGSAFLSTITSKRLLPLNFILLFSSLYINRKSILTKIKTKSR